MGQWSDTNTRKTLTERLTGREDGRVVRSWSEDETYEEMGINPNRPERLSRKDRKAADRVIKDGKQPRRKR